MRYLRNIVLAVLAIVSVVSCSMKEAPDYREQDYGHVQFKLYKAASYEAQPEATKAVLSQLEYLKDVTKIKVTLRYEGNVISQTLVMTAANDDAAEFGLRSDKLKLLAGRYDVLTFSLYDKVDELIYEGTPSSAQSAFDVVPGGLSVHDLLADVVERGKVRFTFVKDLSDFNSNPMTKAPVRSYTFDEIRTITLAVRSESGVKTVFEKLPVVFSMHFDETDDVEDGYRTSSLKCDTLLSLTAGKYAVESYEIFDENKSLIELNARVEAEFEVSDNKITDTDVPVKLY